MRKILLTSCGLAILVLPMFSFGKDLKWSGVLYLKGTGSTNCGKPRITNEAWDRCEEWSKKSIAGNEKPSIEDIELYNIAVENDKGPSWNPKLNCNFRASVKCGYRMEKISAAQKLKLSKESRLKKKAGDASCGEPEPEVRQTAQSDCDVNVNDKKAVAIKPAEKPASSAPEIIGTPPPLLIKAEIQRALNKVALLQGSSGQELMQQAEIALNKRSGTVAAALQKGIKWSGDLSITGKGITNCGESLITGEAWELCEAWAEKKKGQKGLSVKPEVKDISISDVKVENSKRTANDPNPSCTFTAKVKCGYSTAISVVEHSHGTQEQKQRGMVAGKYDLADLFGDGLRWSALLSVEGTGITNCGKQRIRNEAWDQCEAWAEEQKKKGGTRPALKKVELYNVASETEKGPSWDPQQGCSFHATLKCGYRLE